ncbi:hypothetical protein MOSE0_J10022 [Monosporozyma servazzii]
MISNENQRIIRQIAAFCLMAVVILVTLQLITIAKIDYLSLDLTKETIQHDSVETIKRDTVLYSLELPDIYSHTIPTVPDNTKNI